MSSGWTPLATAGATWAVRDEDTAGDMDGRRRREANLRARLHLDGGEEVIAAAHRQDSVRVHGELAVAAGGERLRARDGDVRGARREARDGPHVVEERDVADFVNESRVHASGSETGATRLE